MATTITRKGQSYTINADDLQACLAVTKYFVKTQHALHALLGATKTCDVHPASMVGKIGEEHYRYTYNLQLYFPLDPPGRNRSSSILSMLKHTKGK